MAGTVYNSTSKECAEEVDFFHIHYLREAYQEALSNNARIFYAYKEMEIKYKLACNKFELMYKEYTMSEELSAEHEQVLTIDKDLCKENKGIKQKVEIQNTNRKGGQRISLV